MLVRIVQFFVAIFWGPVPNWSDSGKAKQTKTRELKIAVYR